MHALHALEPQVDQPVARLASLVRDGNTPQKLVHARGASSWNLARSIAASCRTTTAAFWRTN